MTKALFWTPVMRSLGWTADDSQMQTSGAPLLGGNIRFIDLSPLQIKARFAHAEG